MKWPAVTGVRRAIAHWISFALILCVFIFGVVVQVDFVDPSVPFSEALGSADWQRLLSGSQWGDFHSIAAVSLVCLVFHTFSRSWQLRLVSMAVGILVPVFTIGPVMLWAAVVSPLMVYSALAGKVDGEFYGEGMLMIAAVGLWMLLCLVSGVADFVGRPRVRLSAEDLDGLDLDQVKRPRPINRLPKLPSLEPRNETQVY
jgi:hypothetical protein